MCAVTFPGKLSLRENLVGAGYAYIAQVFCGFKFCRRVVTPLLICSTDKAITEYTYLNGLSITH